jgi:PPM family protein phosphatase
MSDNATLLVLIAAAAVLAALLAKNVMENRRLKSSDAGSKPGASASKKRAKKKKKKKRKRPVTKVTTDEGGEGELPKLRVEEDEELELTRLRLTADDDEESSEPTKLETVVPIVYDDEAAVDEPTQPSAFILVTAVGQTDQGRRRKRNEDSYLVMDGANIFVVADGMGGYAGGDVASRLAVEEIERIFLEEDFDEDKFYQVLPTRGAQLVQAIQSANRRVWEKTQSDRDLREMGTTLVAARFSPNKQRVYVGHVGDSRCYLSRDGRFHQVTTDHTAAQQGIVGPLAATLTRALGIHRKVVVDLILGKPRQGDRYILCSDGLSKMLTDEEIVAVLEEHEDADVAVDALVQAANDHGGKDNVTVVIVDIKPATMTT